ncbi:uncharacterized protein LOC105279025 isoform X2 [Ooceraea biroi]|uniref:uncharacterized protein LOC105279025 isoform X2 n=1 Tax=Ooceraea biroi TaxID=2015173 RepID=UPI0005BD08BC|nr:uncharacterized protein LOC105279025 isoform X2 [Ooceraea biroi]
MNDGMDEDESGASSSGTLGPEIIPYNPRASRNQAEKQRRDNLNTNISTMAALVPTVAGSSRRMDKISVLRLAAAFLRTQYTLGRTNYFPPQLNDFDLEQYFVDHLVGSGGFFLVVTRKGKIVYVSRQVEQHLGHVQSELLGETLYKFVPKRERRRLARRLTPDGMKPIYPSSETVGDDVQAESEQIHDRTGSSEEEDEAADSRTTEEGISEIPKPFRDQRRFFQIRLSQRTVSKREQKQYERFDVSGVLRLADSCKNEDSKHRESTTNDIVFAGVVTVPKKRSITELSILDANKSEYVTRHLLDGHIIYCDHRVSMVAGYMSEEVTGANAFKFMHKDDYKWTILGLRQMYDHSEPYGMSCYRLLTKTGTYIFLRTNGYLEYDKDTQKMISFVCINTLISEKEGIKLLKEMKDRYSSMSETNSLFLQDVEEVSSPDSSPGVPSPSSSKSDSEDYSRILEHRIAFLINGISSPVISKECYSQVPDVQYTKTVPLPGIPPSPTQRSRTCDNGKGNHYNRYLQEKEHHMQVKQEPKYMSEKLLSPDGASQGSMSDPEDVKPPSGALLRSDDVNVVGHSGRNNNIQGATYVQSTVLVARKPGTKSRRSHSYTACLDTARHASRMPSGILYGGVAGGIKVEPDVDRFSCKRSSMLQYFGDDDGAVGIGGMREQWPLKRISSEEDLQTMQTKKRLGEPYASTSAADECRDYAGPFPVALSVSSSFNDLRNGTDAQQLPTTESAGVGPSDASSYQQLMETPATTSPAVANPELGVLLELKDDLLLSSDLEANPELMMKIFDTFNHGSTTNFDDNPVKANVQQLVPDEQQVNDEIRRTYHQLANNMALCESQINVLARDFENPALCAQRKDLSQIQAEHNIQKQMLRTLQQDHRKMQVKKQNIEV